MKLISVLVIAAMTSAAPLSAGDRKISYDFSKRTDFHQIKTFAIDTSNKSDEPLVDQRVNGAVTRMLAARGLQQVDESPDVVVVPSRSGEIRRELTTYGYGWPYDPWPYHGWGWGYGGWGYSGYGSYETRTYETRERYDTLIVDVVDPKTHQVLWRGTSVQRIHSHWDAGDLDEEVGKTVAKLMRNFPPVPGGKD